MSATSSDSYNVTDSSKHDYHVAGPQVRILNT